MGPVFQDVPPCSECVRESDTLWNIVGVFKQKEHKMKGCFAVIGFLVLFPFIFEASRFWTAVYCILLLGYLIGSRYDG